MLKIILSAKFTPVGRELRTGCDLNTSHNATNKYLYIHTYIHTYIHILKVLNTYSTYIYTYIRA